MLCSILQVGRALLQNDSAQAAAAAKGELYNVAAVTLQANCSDSNAAANTLSEMESVLTNNLLAVSKLDHCYSYLGRYWPESSLKANHAVNCFTS